MMAVAAQTLAGRLFERFERSGKPGARHSRGSGNPDWGWVLTTPSPPATWMPAFAGMTIIRQGRTLNIYLSTVTPLHQRRLARWRPSPPLLQRANSSKFIHSICRRALFRKKQVDRPDWSAASIHPELEAPGSIAKKPSELGSAHLANQPTSVGFVRLSPEI
jgi:hypothetical protein